MTARALGVALLVLGGCGPFLTEGDYLFVHRNGADMPVWIRGNLDSGVFIVTLHGGPGDSGHEFVLSEGFQRLEEDYAVIYWDQRASGMSQGNPSAETYTVDEFVKDTDAIISVTRDKYGYDEFFLFGHSWGGDLATAYMVDGAQRDAVAGYITLGGTHDEPLAMAESRAWVLRRIEEVIADDIDVAFWKEIRELYDGHPVIRPSDEWHYIYVASLGGYYWNEETYVPPDTIALALASPFSLGFYQNQTRNHRLSLTLTDGFDYTDRIAEITTPALVLAGEHDGSVPAEVAEALFAGIGTPEADKQLTIFEGVAHSCHYEDPSAFVQTLETFIEELGF